MRIVIIGSGNVATHLAKALYLAKEDVIQIWSYHYVNAKLLAEMVNAKAISEISEFDRSADLVLIAVKDDVVEEIVKQIADFNGIMAHTAGSISLDIFKGKVNAYGAFYPLQTFSKQTPINFAKIPVCVEADAPQTLNTLKSVAEKISEYVVEIDSEQRKALHLAAVFACNFTNHMYGLANEILSDHALPFDLIRPLIAETAEKVQHALPRAVQTGPAIRDDQTTMNKHLERLSDQPQLVEIYRIVSERIKSTR